MFGGKRALAVAVAEQPLLVFRCACGQPLTRPVRLLSAPPELPAEDGVDLLPAGVCWRDDRPGPTLGRFLLSRGDLAGTRPHDDPRRTSGCCGPSGIDGPNLVCGCGREVATESADCWTGPHQVSLEPHTFIIAEVRPDAVPGTSPVSDGG